MAYGKKTAKAKSKRMRAGTGVSKTGQAGGLMSYGPAKMDSSAKGTVSAYRLPNGSKLGFTCSKSDPTHRGSDAGPKS